MPPRRLRRTEKTGEPTSLELADGDGAFDTSRLVPHAEANVRIVVEVARDAKRLTGIARMRGEELDELRAQRRGAPRAVTEPPLDAAPALRAGLHARIFA